MAEEKSLVKRYEGDQGASKTLQTLDEEMKTEYGNIYLGLVHYDSSKSLWKEMIGKTLGEVDHENSDR